MEQRTAEWHEARLGKLTASRLADALARTKTGWGAGRANVMASLVCERLTGQPTEVFTNTAMQWGTDTEPKAREAYEFEAGCTVTEIGFIDHPLIAMTGASPDGLVGDLGMVEIKCPNTATHLDTLLGGSIPGKYETQMRWQMICAGRSWCDFVSYDPRLPPHLRFFSKRLHADAGVHAQLERDVADFLSELDAKMTALAALKEAA